MDDAGDAEEEMAEETEEAATAAADPAAALAAALAAAAAATVACGLATWAVAEPAGRAGAPPARNGAHVQGSAGADAEWDAAAGGDERTSCEEMSACSGGFWTDDHGHPPKGCQDDAC